MPTIGQQSRKSLAHRWDLPGLVPHQNQQDENKDGIGNKKMGHFAKS